MKGFSKLFLGLILMTLIGVGFKVDVKAAAAAASVSLDVPSDWTSDMKLYFTGDYPALEDTVAPGNSATFYYEIRIKDGESHNLNGKGGSAIAKLWLKTSRTASGDVNEYSLNGTTFQEGSWGSLMDYEKDTVRSFVKGTRTGDTITLAISADGTGSEKTTGSAATTNSIGTVTLSSPESLSIHKVTLAAKNPSGNDMTGVTYTPSKEFYLLEGESKLASVTQTVAEYTFEKWNEDGMVTNERTVTMSTSPLSYTAIYKLSDTALSITGLDGATVPAKQKSQEFTFTTLFPQSKIEAVTTATLGGKTIPIHFNYTTKKVWIAPNEGIEGYNLPLEFTVDGNKFTYRIDVVDPKKASIRFEQASYTTGINTPIRLNLVTTGPKPKSVAYSVGELTIVSSDATGVTVSSATALNNINVTATPTYEKIGDVTPTADPAKTLVTIQSLKMKDDLFVNKGQTVKLGDFISVGNKDMTVSTLVNNADSYIDLTGGAGSKLKDIAVKGKSKVAALDKTKFVVDGNQMKVTVYEAPSLSVETSSGSSSSGSYTYSYKVTMPKGVYYGDDTSVWVTDLKKAILIFKGSGDDAKTKEVVLDSDWKDDSDKVAMSVTKKLDVKTLTGYLRDIGKKDEETISVYACAVNGKGNNDDTIKTETKEMKAYKISLDTNGGKTSYTVNGDSVSDYFYKIDGVEYTVVARGTGTLDKKSSVNADNATTSSGMATIVLGASGAGVAGERRIKAAFSSSSSGGTDGPDAAGGDGYDDVPKTGESKTDIWILWSVLFIAILGAGFMIWKRFGLVRAIAEAEHQEAVIQREEQVRAEKKAKEDKLNMLKDLRNL